MAKRSRSTPPAVLFLFIAALSLLVGTAGAVPEAAFSGNVTSGAAPLTVQFTDESTGAPTGWAWFFGDETYDGTWTSVNASAWPARYGHTSVALPDGSIVLMGGEGGGGYLNDTWRSTDGGGNWTRVPGNAEWTAREGHTSVALPDGSIVLMGGGDGVWKNDVWQSTDGGATWTEVNASAWPARPWHSSVALPDGSIVLMGGGAGATRHNDVWRSADGGATWTQVTTSGTIWSARYGHTSVAMPDGSIVLMGGEGGGGYLNDVWRSFNGGATWTQVTTSGTIWSTRYGHTAVAMPDGSIVLMGG